MFRIAETAADILKAHIVRGIVFVEEQSCPYEVEIDEFEDSAIHIVGEEDGQPMAAGRLRFLGEVVKLERIAIRKAWRGKGLGHRLVDYMIEVARERGYHRFKMHAQVYLCDFYAAHGFQAQGEVFEEGGIDHYLMVLEDPR